MYSLYNLKKPKYLVISFKSLNRDPMVAWSLSKKRSTKFKLQPHIIFARFCVCVFFLNRGNILILKFVRKKSKPLDSWKMCN